MITWDEEGDPWLAWPRDDEAERLPVPPGRLVHCSTGAEIRRLTAMCWQGWWATPLRTANVGNAKHFGHYDPPRQVARRAAAPPPAPAPIAKPKKTRKPRGVQVHPEKPTTGLWGNRVWCPKPPRERRPRKLWAPNARYREQRAALIADLEVAVAANTTPAPPTLKQPWLSPEDGLYTVTE